MAKKNIYNNLINPQIKPEELDVSMFDEKKELDLSMFDDVVKKKGDSGSTSEVQVSESKDTTVDGITQDGFRKIDTKAIKVQTPIETMEFESNKEPYSSFEYIANKSGSLMKSLVDFGVSYQNQLSLNSPNPVSEAINDVQHQSQQRRTRLEGYDSNKLEDLASFGLGLLLDAPVFAAGGAVGRTASKPLIKTLGLVKQNMLKEGVEQVTAKELTKNLAKKYAANVIQSTASSATALGSYEGLMNVKDQIESGVDLEDVEWSESLKATGHGSLIGSSLGPLAPTFGLANKYLNNIMSKGIGKQAATIGLKAAEIPIEASVFTAVGSSLDKEPMSWESYWDNVLMVGVMKGTGAIQKIKDYSKENAQTYGIEFKPEEAKIAKDKVDVETMEGLDLQPSKIETLLKDKQVPLTAKAKLLWRFAGVRADKLDMSPYDVSISKQGEGATVKVWNKDKELVDLQEFPTWEQADNTAFKVLQQASDLKLWDEARQLTLQQKQKVSDKLGSLQDINEISLIPIFERSPEQQKKVVSFRDAISKVKEEEAKEAEKEATVKEKGSGKGITPPKEDSVQENVKIAPTNEIKEVDMPLNETEKAVQEKPMFTEPEQEVKSEQDILKPTQQDILKPTQGEQAPIVESKEKEAPKEAFQEVTVTDLLEKEETAKKSESSFLPFIFPINILASPRAKRRALDIKQVLKEQFLPSRGMPKAVYNEFLKAKGKINARRFDISRSAEDAKKKLYEAYGGKLTPEQKEEIEIALENLGTSKASKDIAFNVLTKNIPKEAQGIIEKMRNMIDSYSDDIKKLDMIGAGLEGKIDQNTGYYVTRTYRKHTDRDWTWDTIPLKIKEDAANKLLEIFPKLTADEALGMAKEMVESKDFSDSVIRKGNSLADIDQRSLKKRSLFLTDNPEIRALYGENRDPLYNYAVSLTRMAEIAERGKMLENIRDLGLTEGFLSETQSYDKNHIAQIQYNEGVFKGKLGTKPLSSYYTTPEIAKTISNFMEPASPPGKMMRLYMSVITTTKIAKTAGSVKGVIRNFKSNITNALANGNWNIPQITSHIASTAKDKTAWNDFRRELAEENIVGDSSNAGELIKNVEELSNRISEVTRSDESFGEMLKRTTVDKALKVYGGADDIWKVYRYVSEKLKYKDAFVKTGMTEADAELAARKEASKILHKTSTYYSELPLFIQNMRKLPFTNTFVSFPYLTLTNYIGGIQQAVKEIKTPGLAHIGLQRLAGSLAATYVLTAISQFRNKEEGVDEKDLEAWRRFLPDYWRNDMITIKKDNGDGTAEYNNTSYMDYYGVITTPLAMLRRKLVANGTLTDEDLIDAATEFSKSFIGWDIAFDKLTQIKANQDDLGRQIFNPQDDWDDKWKDMLEHLWGTVEPGTLTDVKRMINTSREGGDWEGQLKGMLTGNQARTIDPLKSMDFYILPKYKEQMDNARAIYKNQLRQYKRLVAPGDADNTALQKAKERAEAISNSILSEVILDYDAAIRVGVKQDKLEDVIRGEKFDKDITNAILYRTGLMLDEDGGFLEDVSKTNK
jgi:hypothetical protein